MSPETVPPGGELRALQWLIGALEDPETICSHSAVRTQKDGKQGWASKVPRQLPLTRFYLLKVPQLPKQHTGKGQILKYMCLQ